MLAGRVLAGIGGVLLSVLMTNSSPTGFPAGRSPPPWACLSIPGQAISRSDHEPALPHTDSQQPASQHRIPQGDRAAQPCASNEPLRFDNRPKFNPDDFRWLTPIM
tara:strand:- start:7190 stop:7507 length:318 start_codon:yes stop_codon:yes gene_type:complete